MLIDEINILNKIFARFRIIFYTVDCRASAIVKFYDVLNENCNKSAILITHKCYQLFSYSYDFAPRLIITIKFVIAEIKHSIDIL